MSHVLTLKVPHPLLERLKKVAYGEGKSRGAVVREAIEKLLKEKSEDKNGQDLFQRATEAYLKGKTIKVKVDWEELRRKASEGAPSISPEEEVLQGRRRRLF